MNKQNIIFITPVYEDRIAAEKLFEELIFEFKKKSIFIIAVDDGSVSNPLVPVKKNDIDGLIIQLNRNVGHQQAIAIGLHYVAEHYAGNSVVVMDCDGEDLPSSASLLIEKLKNDGCDVAVAKRRSRTESWLFKTFYVFYRYLFRLLTGKSIAFGNFIAIKPRALSRLVRMQELWTHVAGSVVISKLRIYEEPTDRGSRYHGQSKMNFLSLVQHGFKALTVFAEDVLIRIAVGCLLMAAFVVMSIFIVFLLKLINMATPGWASLLIGMLFMILLQTCMIALLCLLLTNIGKRPQANIDYKNFIDQVIKL